MDTMLEEQSALQEQTIDLIGDALTSFCEDIGGMFGVDMACEQSNVTDKHVAEIKKHYKKVAAVYSVKSKGSINGDLKILIDRAGLFTMGGVVVMLPESRILNNAKRGTLADTVEMQDAVGEVGNLLIGCWGRIFRDGFKDNTHFAQSGTFIGDLFAKGSDCFDFQNPEEATFVSYEVTVGDYPSFQCGVYLPNTLFDVVESEPEPEAVEESEASEPPVEEVEMVQAPEPVQEPVAESESEPSAPTEVNAEPQEATSEAEPSEGATESSNVPESEPVADQVKPDEIASPLNREPQEPTIQSVPTQPPSFHTDYLAKQMMCTEVHWVAADETVGQAQTKMHQLGISYLLVGDGDKLDGIVTKSDLASAASIYLRPIFAKWRRPEDDATLQIRIKWIMSQQIYAVKPETPLSNIVHLKCKYEISYLPVVDTQGKVLGVVTTKDIFKAMMNKELSATGVTMT